MKNKLLIIGLICTSVSIASFSQINGQRYYYAFNKKIFLQEVGDKMVVCFQKNNAADVKARLQTERIEQQNEGICIVDVAGNRKESLKRDLSQMAGVKSVQPMYITYSGVEVGITDEIVMKFYDNVSQQQIDELHQRHRVQIKEATGMRYLVAVPTDSDALETANQYQLSGLIEYCHPDFLAKIENYQTIPTDPYFVNQFYLHNTGQSIIKCMYYNDHSDTVSVQRSGTPGADIRAMEAWDITKGDSSIVIAVLDPKGFTRNHPDLPASRQVWLPGSNFAEDTPGDDPLPIGAHGDACAGIIAATHDNGQGIAGIAPNCKIMPIRVPSDTTFSAITRVANAFRFAKDNRADIISCSWGYEFKKNSTEGFPEPDLFPDIVKAITEVTTQGRGRKGCVVVFAASNSANHANNDYKFKDGYVAFPANVKIPGVLSVGASDRYDQQANYSPTSNLDDTIKNQIIDVVAPSSRAFFCTDSLGDNTEGGEIWTIDIPGAAGYNPVGVSDCSYPGRYLYFPYEGTNRDAYTGYFGGTSAAAPQVASVAALILSKNPSLTQQEVSDIIKLSARKTKEHKYIHWNNPPDDPNNPNPDPYKPFLEDKSAKWNAQMGYGVLDAQAAVLQAQGYYTFFHRTMNNENDDEEISTCKEVLIQDVDLQGDVKFTVESGKRIVIKPPFKANPFGSNAARFYAGINQNLCNSPKLQSSPPPEAQRANSVPTKIIQPVVRDAFLAQNAPNPAREQTVIPYYIPESFRSASLLFTTIMGVRVKQIPIPTGGEGEAAISVSELPAGMYLYSLLVDGRVVATKRMLVSR